MTVVGHYMVQSASCLRLLCRKAEAKEHMILELLTLRMLCLQQRPPMHRCPEYETESVSQPLSQSQLGIRTYTCICISPLRVILLRASTGDKDLGCRKGRAGERSYLCVHQARGAKHTTKAATMLDTTTTTKQ